MAIKEEMLEEISLLASRADLCARQINFTHRPQKSTTTERTIENENAYEYALPIFAQKRMRDMHIELLSCVRRCEYVATVNVGAISHRTRKCPPKNENEITEGVNTEEFAASPVEGRWRKTSPFRSEPTYSAHTLLLTGLMERNAKS